MIGEISNIGLRIKTARKQKGMNQGQLANIIGVANTAISNYEKGTSTPSVEKIALISTALDVDLSWFILGQSLSDSSTTSVDSSKGMQEGGVVSVLGKGSTSKETPMTAAERKQFQESLEEIKQLKSQLQHVMETHQSMAKAQQEMVATIKRLTEMLGDKRG